MGIKYSAGLVSQSFWFVEFKKMVQLILEGKSEEEIRKLCINDNIFGIQKEYRAKEIYNHVKRRVKRLDSKLLDLFAVSDVATQKLINLIAIIQGDNLFFDFLYEVYRGKNILGQRELSKSDINTFFSQKEFQDDSVAHFTDETKKRLGSAYFNFMTDANLLIFVDKKRLITPPVVDCSLEEYLDENRLTPLLKAITGVV